MAFKLSTPRQPNMDPKTDKDKFDNLFLFQEQMIREGIDRGNDLCEIIYSLMYNNGPSKLNEAQKQRVALIKKNIEHKDKHHD